MTTMRAGRWVYLLLIALSFVGGCRDGDASTASGLPTIKLHLGHQDFTLEVAATQESRERGLMRRDLMAADHGMIFVFDKPQAVGFYMKNTRIPLDIVFIDESGGVITIAQMKPYDLSTTPSGGPVKWAVELNKDAAANAGIKVGDKVQIPETARTAEP